MVGTGILSNNMRSPSPECYTTFWMMTIYSDTFHWSGITPIFDPITDLDLITIFDFLPNCERFPLNICKGCDMPKEDAYSSGHLVLSHFGTCKSSHVETNLSWTCLVPDFWVSNIPLYFFFCLQKYMFLDILPLVQQNEATAQKAKRCLPSLSRDAGKLISHFYTITEGFMT